MLLVLDGNVDADLVCITCGANAAYRCTMCSCDRRYCQGCIVAAHVTSPFHFVEVSLNNWNQLHSELTRPKHWNGRFWAKTTLDSLGFVKHLGHKGKPCPRATGPGRCMHILHTTGVHVVRTVFCACPAGFGHSSSANLECNQLLRDRLFPTTVKQPATAVSFPCLNEFHLLTTQGKLTGMDYYETLIHLTDNLGIDPPNVSNTPLQVFTRFISFF